MGINIDVIGGGPAGMMAAIAAARQGASVRLWEKNHSLSRKLLATGNGRCNFTNRDLSPEFFHGGRPETAARILGDFGLDRTLSFFRELGVEPACDERGRYFPRSQEASSVLLALEREMEGLGVAVALRSDIVRIERAGAGYTLHRRGESHRADRVIIACGGMASPQFGSSGGGHELAAQLGHRITPLRPGLASWEMAGPWFHTLQGVRWDMELIITGNDGRQVQLTDEGLFTKHGLSGPLALRSSRSIGEDPKTVTLSFVPGMGRRELEQKIAERRKALPGRSAADFLTGLLPEKIGRLLARESGIPLDVAAGSLGHGQLGTLAKNMTCWPVKVKGLRPFKEAQVTVGGVDMGQVRPETLESALAPGLFFCGEVLDVDGDSGGYNLQWCWSSGWAAGNAAGRTG